MATLEELEARLTALQTQVNNIKSCTCDPTKYASQTEFELEKNKIAAIQTYLESLNVPDTSTFATKAEVQTAANNVRSTIGNVPNGYTVVSYIDENTHFATQQMQTTPMYEFMVPAGSESITITKPSGFWDAAREQMMVTVNGGQALETTSHIGGDAQTISAVPYVYISNVGGFDICVTAYASADKDISVDRRIAFYGMETVFESVKTKVSALEDKIDNLPESGCDCDVTKIYKLPYTGAEFGAKLAKI